MFATRDQWAKYVLIKHRKSYDIYVDEKKPIKAVYHALNGENRPKIKIKIERENDTKTDSSSTDELNERLAAAQKAEWAKGKDGKKSYQILEEIKQENNSKESKNTEEKFDEKVVMKTTVIKDDEKFNYKSLIGLTSISTHATGMDNAEGWPPSAAAPLCGQ